MKSPAKDKAKEERATDEVLEYYSGEEVKQIYKVKKTWLYASAKRHQIPMCRIAGRNYYSKKDYTGRVRADFIKRMFPDVMRDIEQDSIRNFQVPARYGEHRDRRARQGGLSFPF